MKRNRGPKADETEGRTEVRQVRLGGPSRAKSIPNPIPVDNPTDMQCKTIPYPILSSLTERHKWGCFGHEA